MFRLQGEQARKLGKVNETQWKKGEFEYHQTQLLDFLYFVDVFGILLLTCFGMMSLWMHCWLKKTSAF